MVDRKDAKKLAKKLSCEQMALIILYVFGYMEFVTREELGTRERIFRFHLPRHTGLAQFCNVAFFSIC